jgi:hypothetical protein
VLKNGASGRDPALHGYCKCSHIKRYAALSNPPRALADGPMLVLNTLLDVRSSAVTGGVRDASDGACLLPG